MRRLIVSILLLAGFSLTSILSPNTYHLTPITSAQAQTVTQTFYVDFGENNVSSRGNLTTGADANGHYWTNVYSSPSEKLYPTDWKLVNSENVETDYVLQIGTYFHTNGMSGGGGLQSPSASLLGDLAIATATQDYMHVETFQDYNIFRLVNLDPQKAYRFNCFGSRVVAEERGGYLRFQGENSWSDYMQMSGSGIGANSYNGNNNKIMVSDPIFPTKDGVITVLFDKKFKGGMIYLNCMKVEELEGLERPNQELTLSQKFYIDFGETSNDSRGHQTTTADQNGNTWNNLSSGSSSSNVIATNKTVTLKNSEGTRSGYKMTTLSQFLTNGVNNGGNNNPTVENLGDLAVQTATEDYAFTEDDNTHSIKFSGLDKNKCYRFYIYGCRTTTESDRRFCIYSLSGQNDWQTGYTTSGQHVGGQNVHGNMRNVAMSDYIYPDTDGNITFGVLRNQNPKSNFAHFNIIKIEEYEGGTRPEDAERYTEPVISGTAVENGTDVSLNELKPNGVSSGVYETYLRLQPGTYTLKGKNSAGEIVAIGDETTVEEEKVVRVRYDSKKADVTVTPVELYLKGNIVADGTTVAYKGDGVFEQEVDMNYGTVFLFSDKYFYFAFNNDDNLAVKRQTSFGYGVGMPSEGFASNNFRINRGTYTITLDMRNYTWNVNAPIDEYKISAFGSSVCNGQGAANNQGYAYLYGNLLNSRYKKGQSEYPFVVSGVAIGGNTTNNLLERYDEMIHDFGKYVIIGLSMANEGLHGTTNKQGIFDQFKTNMLKLIQMMEDDGKTVVVMNNYPHGDYTLTDYSYIKKMDLLIHEWDVASVNTLGAIDNGTGNWADGFMSDAAHPTTAGHNQFYYAMPPSLFDALENGKPFPVRDMTQSTVLENGSTLNFVAEGSSRINPHTLSVRIKGTEAGKVAGFITAAGKSASVEVLEDGRVKYTSISGDSIVSAEPMITDHDKWYTITFTNYYAQKRVLCYVDDTCIGELTQCITPKTFFVGDSEKALHRAYSELTFWRSAMNEDEIKAHNAGKMLKSSLEIYSPSLAANEDGTVTNLAQSLNVATFVQGEAVDAITTPSINNAKQSVTYDLQGRKVNDSYKGIVIKEGKKAIR